MAYDLKIREGTRNTTLDILRGAAILIVVLEHAIQVNLPTGGVPPFIWNKVILVFELHPIC